MPLSVTIYFGNAKIVTGMAEKRGSYQSSEQVGRPVPATGRPKDYRGGAHRLRNVIATMLFGHSGNDFSVTKINRYREGHAWAALVWLWWRCPVNSATRLPQPNQGRPSMPLSVTIYFGNATIVTGMAEKRGSYQSSERVGRPVPESYTHMTLPPED